jgi:hypothetical protein
VPSQHPPSLPPAYPHRASMARAGARAPFPNSDSRDVLHVPPFPVVASHALIPSIPRFVPLGLESATRDPPAASHVVGDVSGHGAWPHPPAKRSRLYITRKTEPIMPEFPPFQCMRIATAWIPNDPPGMVGGNRRMTCQAPAGFYPHTRTFRPEPASGTRCRSSPGLHPEPSSEQRAAGGERRAARAANNQGPSTIA